MTDFIDAETGEILPGTEDNVIVAPLRQRTLRNGTFQDRVDFWVSPEPNSGCWLWTGVLQQGGYARITWKGRNLGRCLKADGATTEPT